MSNRPTLSIVVTIVDGGRYLRDFLLAVMAMDDLPPLEIIVPYDASIADTKLLGNEFPHVQFVDMGVIVPTRSIHSQGGFPMLTSATSGKPLRTRITFGKTASTK